MATVSLAAKARDTIGKGNARKLRQGGEVPAVIYGHSRDAQSLSINSREIEKLLHQIAGTQEWREAAAAWVAARFGLPSDRISPDRHVLPLTGTRDALVFSIPQILRLRDTLGKGVADKRDPFYATFETRDTHGMTNNFVRGFDGWIYANHGFRNEDVITAQDGSSMIEGFPRPCTDDRLAGLAA